MYRSVSSTAVFGVMLLLVALAAAQGSNDTCTSDWTKGGAGPGCGVGFLADAAFALNCTCFSTNLTNPVLNITVNGTVPEPCFTFWQLTVSASMEANITVDFTSSHVTNSTVSNVTASPAPQEMTVLVTAAHIAAEDSNATKELAINAMIVPCRSSEAPTVTLPAPVQKGTNQATVQWQLPVPASFSAALEYISFEVLLETDAAAGYHSVYNGSGTNTSTSIFVPRQCPTQNVRVHTWFVHPTTGVRGPACVEHFPTAAFNVSQAPSAPGAPIVNTANSTVHKLFISWANISDDGGCPLLTYIVTISGGNGTNCKWRQKY